MAKRGPKPKINAVVERDIIACLSVGATLRDCAQYCGIGYRTLMEKRKNDPKFRTRTKQAEIKGKVYHLKKIKNAPQWQASAFILERKWWKEFGRRELVKQEISGPAGKPIQHEDVGLKKLSMEELQKLRELRAKMDSEASSN